MGQGNHKIGHGNTIGKVQYGIQIGGIKLTIYMEVPNECRWK